MITKPTLLAQGILKGGFQDFNPLSGRNPMRMDLD